MRSSIIHATTDPNDARLFVSSNIDWNVHGQRWTEARNSKSIHLSSMSVEEGVGVFADSHRRAIEILSDPRTFAPLVHLSRSIKSNPPERIIFGGAGSSGRVAILAAHDHTEALFQNRGIEVLPWMVGGAEAVARTAESAEDNPGAILEWLKDGHHGDITERDLVIGVSCGASAPSVAGALLYAHERGARTALLANNPFALAPDVSVEGLEGGMKGVLTALHETKSFYPLPALYGAELLSGSTRLNGGSTSLIVLDTLLTVLNSTEDPLTAVRRHHSKLLPQFEREWTKNLLQTQEATTAMSEALREGRAIQFLGSERIGRVCVLDASEHPPTFGVPVGRVQAMVSGGWGSVLGEFYDEDVCKQLESKFSIAGGTMEGFEIRVEGSKGEFQTFVFDSTSPLAAKMILNTVSTVAFAKAGFVEGNIMVNMIPSNVKLIQRAISIIDKVTDCGEEVAERSLRLAIFGEGSDGTETHADLAAAAGVGVLPAAIAIARSR